MGRPKGSKNKTSKRVPAAVGSVTADHNAAAAQDRGLTEDQKAALFFEAVRKASVIENQIAELTGERGSIYAQAKADLGDKGLQEVKFAVKIRNKGGELCGFSEKRVQKEFAKIDAQLSSARLLGVAVGQNLSFDFGVDENDPRTPAADRAYAEGKRDGLAGLDRSTRYKPGNVLYERYCEGYADGQRILMDKIGQKPEIDASTAAPVPQEGTAQADPFPAPWEMPGEQEGKPEVSADAPKAHRNSRKRSSTAEAVTKLAEASGAKLNGGADDALSTF